MKLRQDDNIVISNTNNEKRFTIAASAKAFKILSDSLYSRKIEAIVRELSCNAYDSHVQAGWPERPFIITAPNMWQPEFSVEDFGVGLDNDDIENIYTSYFTSTKTESNDVIGALGLGSKTPFSYTDAFNIRSRKNGVEYTYSSYINGMGEPSVSMLSKVDTTEPNGVKITVPVRQQDFSQFKDDIRKVAKWFKDAPEINGADDITIDNRNAVRLHEEEFFWVRRGTQGVYHTDRVVAVMGNVAYQVDSISTTFSEHLTGGEKAWLNENLVYIKFNIGDLDVAASRETISFDEQTIEIFVERLVSCIRGYSEDIQTEIDSCASVVDAIGYVEREVGFWANSLFTFSDAYMSMWVEQDLMSELRRVFMHNKADINERLVFDNDYTYSGTGYYTTTVRKRNMRYDSLKLSQTITRKFVVIDNCEGVSTTRIARAAASAQQSCYVFVAYDKLLDTQVSAIKELLGDRVSFIDAVVERDRLSAIAAVERAVKKRKLEEEAEITGVPVPRAEKIKKTIIRAWLIEVDTDKEHVIEYKDLSDNGKLDLSILDGIDNTKAFRVPLLRFSASIGKYTVSVNPQYGEFQKLACIARLHRVKYMIVYLPADRVRNEKVLCNYRDLTNCISAMKVDQMFIAHNFIRHSLKCSTASNLGLVAREVAGDLITPEMESINAWYNQFNDMSIYTTLVESLLYSEQRKFDGIVSLCTNRVSKQMEVIAERVNTEYPLLQKMELSYAFSSNDARDYVSIVRLAKAYIESQPKVDDSEIPVDSNDVNDLELNEVA